jgi:hypothetical protein
LTVSIALGSEGIWKEPQRRSKHIEESARLGT